MKNLLVLLLITAASLHAQVYFDVDQSVKMTATLSAQPPTITVNWIQDPRTISYGLYRRIYGADSWGTKIANYPPEITEYVDTDVLPNQLYEYKVEKFVDGVEGYGYVLSGIEMPAVHQAGELLVVITEDTRNEVASDLAHYLAVLNTDGWPNKTILVGQNAPVSQIKADILSAYETAPFTAILLLGDVPMAFSGNINPDAHADHKGAWPADGYYGDLDGIWTDSLIDNTTADTPVNHNIPGDEKWDQSFFPSDIKIAVGRVDFTNLTVFDDEDEYSLLRKYLRKNIDYRTRTTFPRQRAMVRNSNPWIGALGQNGIRNFSTLVSPDSLLYGEGNIDYEDSYLWYYGAGSETVRNGLSYLFNFREFNSVFNLWFSSYVGDYALEDNYMKAALGSGTALTSVWAGAPHWHFHSMAMGFPIGHATTVSQNNDTIYTAGFFPRGVHVNLIGDPTLKSYTVAPPTALTLTETLGSIGLNWVAAAQTPDQYYLYRRLATEDYYSVIDSTAGTVTAYQDSCLQVGTEYDYLVRASKLKVSPSGSFSNLSTGAAASIVPVLFYEVVADFTININNDGSIFLTSTSTNAESLLWQLPNGTTYTTETVEYPIGGLNEIDIYLIARNRCSVDTSFNVLFISVEEYTPEDLAIYPNPASTVIQVSTSENINNVALVSVEGKYLIRKQNLIGRETELNVSSLPAGIYTLQLTLVGGIVNRQIIINR
jgi:hypothetical protein